ncbi:hypothetical protein, partial [Corynebacterium heidelbergense]|uniref:hypothetical protein n=1 Tax=Corynebacterium heidelbergense TaxID=2055947 RepID=UPI001EE75B8C
QAAASADHTPPHAHPQKEHTHSNAKQTKNASSTLLSSQTPHAPIPATSMGSSDASAHKT